MSFTSNVRGMPVIGDHNYKQYVDEAKLDPTKGRGRVPRDYSIQPFGSLPYTDKYTLRNIPRDEWASRIEEREKKKTRTIDICNRAGLKVKNQSNTNYCWINAPTHMFEVYRVLQNQRMVSFSPSSAGAIIKGFRNVGGWGTEGVKFLAEVGLVPTKYWPDNAWNGKQYDTNQTRELRKQFQVQDFMELSPHNFNQLMTCVLLGIPVAIGLNWWSHEILAVDGAVLGHDEFGIIIDNSWGTNWGDNGRGVLTQSKATPDDAIAIKTIRASSLAI